MTTQVKAEPKTKEPPKEKTYTQAEVDGLLATQKKTHDTQIKTLTASYEEAGKKEKAEIKRLKAFETSSELDEEQRADLFNSLKLDERESALDKREVDLLMQQHDVPEEHRMLIASLRSDMREQGAIAFGRVKPPQDQGTDQVGKGVQTSFVPSSPSAQSVDNANRTSGPGGAGGSQSDKDFLGAYERGETNDHARAGQIFKTMGLR